MAGYFELFVDVDGAYRFRLACVDGKTLVVSGPYAGRVAAVQALRATRDEAAMAHVRDVTGVNDVEGDHGLLEVGGSASRVSEEFCNPVMDHPDFQLQPWMWP